MCCVSLLNTKEHIAIETAVRKKINPYQAEALDPATIYPKECRCHTMVSNRVVANEIDHSNLDMCWTGLGSVIKHVQEGQNL